MKKVSISACEGERIGISFPFDAEYWIELSRSKGEDIIMGKKSFGASPELLKSFGPY